MAEMLTVYVSNPENDKRYARLILPATDAEMLDAFARAGITDSTACGIEIVDCKSSALWGALDSSTDIVEFDALARAVETLDWQEMICLEYLVSTHLSEHGTIAPDKAIWLAGQLHRVSCVGVGSLRSLGELVLSNEINEQLARLVASVIELLDVAKIGKQQQEADGGQFINGFYYYCDEPIVMPSELPRLQAPQKPHYVFRMEIANGILHPEEGSGIVEMKLPIDEEELNKLPDIIGAASIEDCTCNAFESTIPQITEEVYDSYFVDFDTLNELAGSIAAMNDTEHITYKAMLEATGAGGDMEEALALTHKVGSYTLLRELSSRSDYAAKRLQERGITEADDLLANVDLNRYGEQLMAREHAQATSYGVLTEAPQQTMTERQAMDMTM